MTMTTIEYSAAGRSFRGEVFSNPEVQSPRPGVLVFHCGAGLTDHERNRAQMLAKLGFIAFAPDLFGETFRDRARGIAIITQLVSETQALRERVNSALERLRREPGVDAGRLAAIGFCFGGLAALELARSGADVDAVVSFQGGLQTREPARRDEVACKLLVCAGGADPFVTREHRASFEDEMTRANADWQMILYGGAQHGFTETSTSQLRAGCAYSGSADRRSWCAMRDLFSEAMGPRGRLQSEP